MTNVMVVAEESAPPSLSSNGFATALCVNNGRVRTHLVALKCDRWLVASRLEA